MRTISFAAFFFALQLLAKPGLADDIKEANYPVRYEVLTASKADAAANQKGCSMELRDKSNPKVIITVSRRHIGSCTVLPGGKVFEGRENAEKNVVELVIPVGESKARVESWHIDGTVKNPQ